MESEDWEVPKGRGDSSKEKDLRGVLSLLPIRASVVKAKLGGYSAHVVRSSRETGSTSRGFNFWSSICIILLPTMLYLSYLGLFSSYVYVAEAKVTVKEASGATSSVGSGISSILDKIGISKNESSTQDSQIIAEYVKSRSAVQDVGGLDYLRSVYGGSEIDWYSRLPIKPTAEKLWNYWKEHATASVDTTSNIVTIRVQAFSPDNALELTRRVTDSSEKLINQMSLRSRNDALARAQDQVARSMGELAATRAELVSFQQKTGSLDPIDKAKEITSIISKLTTEKLQLENQLSVSKSVGVRDKPGDRYMEAQLRTLNDQIAELNSRLTGPDGDKTVSGQLKIFELLRLKQEFAEQMYSLSRSSLEAAKRSLSHQQVYLAIVVPPLLPEEPSYPKVFAQTSLFFFECFIVWGITCLLYASVKDSRAY